MNKTLEAAIEYVEKYKFSVIPLIPGDKKPSIKWEPFQTRLPEKSALVSWFGNNPKANIGIVTGKVSNLFVIDLDKYAEGYSDDIANQYIPESVITPTVETARGGQHLYFNDPGGDFTIRARALPGIDFRGNNGYVVAPPSINGTGKPWKWSIGLDTPREAVPEPFLDLLKHINNKSTLYMGNNSPTLQNLTNLTTPNIMFELGRRDEDLFHTANCLVKGGMPQEEIAQILERLIISWGEPPDAKWIQTKIESAFGRSEKRDRNLTAEVRNWISLHEGYFFLTETKHDLTTPNMTKERAAIDVIIKRLVDDGTLEKVGGKRGCYKIREPESENIDFLNADTTGIFVQWPLGIEDYFKTMPKNIIMVAGEVNAGKTAFLLNLARLNMHKHKVKYFSSEMGAAELKERLSKFEMPLKEWTKVCFKEKASDFGREIDPEGLNIIDFLEMHDEFYKMGALIRDIYDKLTTGIAVIAIQKNKGRDEGLGGERSKEKARLYLAIEPGKIKMVKVKNWANPEINPNGHQVYFKLAQGCRFKKEGDWYKA